MVKMILSDIYNYIRIKKFKAKWRNINQHNRTHANTVFPIENVKIGNGTYGNLNIRYYGNKHEKLKIGNYCSIADGVYFIMGGEHDYKHISTYPFKKIFVDYNIKESYPKGPIIIEDDVWIGFGATIKSGVRIGQGAVVATGSIVYKDIPPYSIYVGNEIKKYRFESNIIEILKKIDYSKINDNLDYKKIELLYKEIENLNEKELKELIEVIFNEK